MLPVFALLLVLAVSLLIIRVGTIVLTLTGLSEDVAGFQALSAFTGTGFTTPESSSVVDHPARRRIISHLMILGNLGVVSAVTTAILSVGELRDPRLGMKALALLTAGLAGLLFFSFNHRVRKWLSAPLTRSLSWMTGLDLKDYAEVLQVHGGYQVVEFPITDEHWAVGKNLAELDISSRGVWVLGLWRQDEEYIGVPGPRTKLLAGDVVVVYGLEEGIELFAAARREPEDPGDPVAANTDSGST